MIASPPPDTGPEDSKQASLTVWEAAAVLAPFVVVWAVYLTLRRSMPDDALAPFRNGLYWPDGGELLLAKGGSLASRIVIQVLFTFGLGLGLFVGFFLVKHLFVKTEGKSPLGALVCFALAFAIMLGVTTVPDRIARLDPERGAIVVSRMIPVPPWEIATETLAIDEVSGLGTKLGRRGTKSKEVVVRLFALRGEGEPLELGEAACPDGPSDCVAWAEPAVALYAERLGWKGAPVLVSSGGDMDRRYEARGVDRGRARPAGGTARPR